MKAIAVLLLVAAVFLPNARAQTAEEIIARSIEARGGLAALRARQSVKMVARVDRPQEGLSYSMTLFRKRPTFYRAVLEAGDTTIIRATDGESAWVVSTLAGNLEPAEMPAGQAATFKRQAHMDTSLQGLLPTGSSATFLDRVEDDDGEFLRVRMAHQDGSEMICYYDADTYLVRKTSSMQQTGTTEREAVVLLNDYREVDGVFYSFRAERRVGGITVSVTRWTSFEHNVAMEDSMFRMPR